MENRKLKTEANAIMDNFIVDPVRYFPDLLDFVKLHAVDPALVREMMILGSSINENRSFSPNDYVTKGNKIVAEMLSESNDTVSPDFKKEKEEIKYHFLDQRPRQRTVVEVKDIRKKISSTFSISDISFKLKLGEITGVVGENGNGKTSLLRLIAGELKPTAGSICYPRFDQGKLRWIKIKENIGYVRQSLPPVRIAGTVRQQLIHMAALKGGRGEENLRQFEFIVSRLGIDKFKDYNWNELSGGYRLRFEIAKQLIWKPKLLVLDEPLSNLDVKTQLSFLSDLRSLTNSISNSMAVIISSQNLYEIEKVADNMVFLRDGKALYNGPIMDLGSNFQGNCFELDVDEDILELKRILAPLDIPEIRKDVFYKLIFSGPKTKSSDVLSALAEAGIEVRYFREITHSTRLLFER